MRQMVKAVLTMTNLDSSEKIAARLQKGLLETERPVTGPYRGYSKEDTALTHRIMAASQGSRERKTLDEELAIEQGRARDWNEVTQVELDSMAVDPYGRTKFTDDYDPEPLPHALRRFMEEE